MSEAAQAAKLIRAELKNAFPNIKFSVRSDYFSGGSSVDIRWTDGPKTDEVEAITRKYQYGHFNGMEDIYEYSNSRDDLPQAKYVQTAREISEETKARIQADIMKKYGMDEWTDESCQKIFSMWPQQVIWREANKA